MLAPIGRAPVHRHIELVRLYQAGRLCQTFTDLSQKEDKSVGPRPVARQSGVGLDNEAAVHRAAHQIQCGGRVPLGV